MYPSKCAIQTRSNTTGVHCWIPFLFAQRDTSDLCRMTWGISRQVLLWNGDDCGKTGPDHVASRKCPNSAFYGLNVRVLKNKSFIKLGQMGQRPPYICILSLNWYNNNFNLLYIYEHMIEHIYLYMYVCLFYVEVLQTVFNC